MFCLRYFHAHLINIGSKHLCTNAFGQVDTLLKVSIYDSLAPGELLDWPLFIQLTIKLWGHICDTWLTLWKPHPLSYMNTVTHICTVPTRKPLATHSPTQLTATMQVFLKEQLSFASQKNSKWGAPLQHISLCVYVCACEWVHLTPVIFDFTLLDLLIAFWFMEP